MHTTKPKLTIPALKAKAPPFLTAFMHAPVLIHSFGCPDLLLFDHEMHSIKKTSGCSLAHFYANSSTTRKANCSYFVLELRIVNGRNNETLKNVYMGRNYIYW